MTTSFDVPIDVVSNNIEFEERFGAPTAEEMALFDDSISYHYRRCDIYDSNGLLWRGNVGVTEGSVTISHSRDERRTADLTIDNSDESIIIDPEFGLWYDKVVHLYRGIVVPPHLIPSPWPQDTSKVLYWSIGVFVIDRISTGSDNKQISITMRDLTKKMLQSKMALTTEFEVGNDIGLIVRALAANSGISKLLVPLTGKLTTKPFTFDRGTSRWEAAKTIANDFGYQLFFDARGWLVMVPYTDPLTSPISLRLIKGNETGYSRSGYRSNMASYSRAANDSMIFNHVVVSGEATANEAFVSGQSENNEPTSPTRIGRIGRRTNTYTSQFIETNEQAQALADAMLKIQALEQHEISAGMGVFPWIEVFTTASFDDEGTSYEPARFLLQNVTIPVALGEMSITGSRVSLVVGSIRWLSGSGRMGVRGNTGSFA